MNKKWCQLDNIYEYMNMFQCMFSKYYIFIIFSCLLISNIFLTAHGQNNDVTLFEESIKLIKEKQFQSSLIKIRDFLSTNPDNFKAKTTECTILLELDQLDEAESCITENLAEIPNDLDNLTNLGILYISNKNYESAKTQFSILHEQYPQDEVVYANLLAVKVILNDDVEQVIQEHKNLLEKNPFNVQVLVNLGKIFNDKRKFDEAKYFLDRAYELDNTHVNVLEQLGIWYALNGDLENAKKYFLNAIEISPNNISVLNNLGLLYRDLGDKSSDLTMYYNSTNYYQSVLLLEPDNVYANDGIEYSSKKIQDIYDKFYFNIYAIALAIIVLNLIIIWKLRYDQKLLEILFKKEPEHKKLLIKLIITKSSKIVLLGALFIVGLILAINKIGGFSLNDGWDMANWTSTVVEIGIGAILALIILVYEISKNDSMNQQQITITGETKSIIEKQLRDYDERYRTRYNSMHIYSSSISFTLEELILEAKDNPKITTGIQNKLELIKQESNDLEYSAGTLAIGILPNILTTKGIEISKLGLDLYNPNDSELNMSKCLKLQKETNELLQLLNEHAPKHK